MVYYQPHAILHKYDLYKLWTANYINFVIFWQITWAEFKVETVHDEIMGPGMNEIQHI